MIEIGGAGEPDDALTSKYGSKFRRILRVASELVASGETVLMFTQWASHGRILQTSLKEQGIAASYMEGNASRRKTMLQRFKDGTVPVLVCSNQQSVDGLNLGHCGHIFFTHALVGNADFVRKVEKQMIGRLKRIGQTRSAVHVHDFITQDTQEEQLWLSTHQET
jgi:SNF2 family DNA or RNA helicase